MALYYLQKISDGASLISPGILIYKVDTKVENAQTLADVMVSVKGVAHINTIFYKPAKC